MAALIEMEDRPWPEWRHGKPMTAASLARLLKPFGVRPRKLRLGGHALNGYQRGEIEAAHIRYCPTPPVQTHYTTLLILMCFGMMRSHGAIASSGSDLRRCRIWSKPVRNQDFAR